jgi:hypothetical protein
MKMFKSEKWQVVVTAPTPRFKHFHIFIPHPRAVWFGMVAPVRGIFSLSFPHFFLFFASFIFLSLDSKIVNISKNVYTSKLLTF